MKKLVVIILLLLVAVVGLKQVINGKSPVFGSSEWVMQNPYAPGSPLYAQNQRVVDRFNAEPDLRKRFAGANDSKELYAAFKVALTRGGQSVSDERLLGMIKAMRAVVPRLQLKNCAKLMLDQDDFDSELGADLRQVLENLPAGAHQRFGDFYIDALLAEVHHAPVRPVDPEALKSAEYELGYMFQNDADRLLRVARSPEHSSEEDRCWFSGVMAVAMENLSEPNAIALARYSWGRSDSKR